MTDDGTPRLSVVGAGADAGWASPTRPLPARALVIRCTVVGVVMLLGSWIYAARVYEARSLTDRVERVTRAAPEVPARAGFYRRRGRTWVAQHVDVRASSARRVDVVVASPAAVDAGDVSLRAWSQDAVVRLYRSTIDEPFARVDRRAGRGVVHLLIVRPVTDEERQPAGKLPDLSTVTDPFERRAARSQASAERLGDLRRRGLWLLPLALLVAVAAPLAVYASTRRRWFGIATPRAPQNAPTGPPGRASVLAAALITHGTHAIDIGDAFAAQVLELVNARVIDARRAVDDRRSPAVMLRVANRPDDLSGTEAAALDVLERAT
ncbi:MAG: hypothetical protein JWN41_974, partial [Thermoleophilia bacterium]|nr:hypothetical protein [Thermoleophilia bacterium]